MPDLLASCREELQSIAKFWFRVEVDWNRRGCFNMALQARAATLKNSDMERSLIQRSIA